MASLPPRKFFGTKTRQTLSPLQTLLQMGFTKHRAEKALAATGNKGVQLASDWLLSHVSDPTLDEPMPREYILYLCPMGPLLDQINDFFHDSYIQCGRNAAHNYLPHLTLCSFFQAPDESVPHLMRALQHVADKLIPEFPAQLDLDPLFVSSTFLGLFLTPRHNDALKRLAVLFMREVSDYIVSEMGALDVLGTCFPWCSSSSYPALAKGGRRIQVEPYLKGLHITLASHFPPEQLHTLEELARRIDTTAPAQWELRLYSRDPRIKGNQVHKVLYSYVPQEADELEMLIGDFVYVNGELLANQGDGWVEGTSWLTGLTGFLPKNYIERTTESDAWTLHKAIPLLKRGPPERTPRGGLEADEEDSEKTDAAPLLTSKLKKQAIPPNTGDTGCRRQVFVVRHGERVDFTFGHSWISSCFNATGTYSRRDLNLPLSVPPRPSPSAFKLDSPLTNIGLYQATLTGEALKQAGVEFSQAFSSPSLRCMQTCANILRATGSSKAHICVEPGLFEWLSFYKEQGGCPSWLAPPELSAAVDWPVDSRYQSAVVASDLPIYESCEQFYHRSRHVALHILNVCAAKEDWSGNILVVGHAATLDVVTRGLCGLLPRTPNEMMTVLHKVPYCGLAVARENEDGTWGLTQPPIPPLRHSASLPFDWTCLMT